MSEIDKSQFGRILLSAAGLETTQLEPFLRRLAEDDSTLAEEIRRRVSVPEDAADSFLELPAVRRLTPFRTLKTATQLPPEVETPAASADDAEGARISERYELGRCLGEGGMARVFEAFDHKLSRRLALKFLTRDEPQIVAHFLREARAQAQVRHRHVLEVYDTGELEGRPYIAMRLVTGTTLGEIAPSLTLEQRLQLLAQAAEGLHAAHTQGLVHRDVKPSNILVEESSGGGLEAFIADFGIASLAEGADGDDEALSGTLPYMAPERLSSRRGMVDRRSDVYSLGGTLYRILSGALPFGQGDPAALIYRILHRDPVPLRQHVPELPVEIEAIVMCCLSRSPSERYASAQSVAEDLKRYLTGEIVEAHTATLAYRLTHFVQRHRWLVTMAGVAVVALVVASVLITVFALETDRQRQRAELRRQQAEELIEFMVGDLRKKLSSSERLEVLDDVHAAAMEYFAAVPAAELTDDELARRSQALYQIGEVRIRSGDVAAAVAPLEESLELARRLSERDPTNATRLFDLGQSYFWVGFVRFKQSQPAAARPPFEAYLAIAQKLTALDPEHREWRLELSYAHSNLGSVLEDLGNFEGALAHFQETLKIDQQLVAAQPQDPELAAALGSTHNTLGETLQKLGRLDASQAHFEADLAIDRRLAAAQPSNHHRQSSLATSLDFLASHLLIRGQIDGARRLLTEARTINGTLVTSDPQNAVWQKKLAWTHLRLAEAGLVNRCFDEALEELQAARGLLAAGLASNASHEGWHHLRSATDYTLARVWFEQDLSLADANLRAARGLLEEQSSGYATSLLLGKCLLLEGWIETRRGHGGAASKAWRDAAGHLESLAQGSQNGQVLAPWAEVLFALGRTEEAHGILEILAHQGFIVADFVVLCREPEASPGPCPALPPAGACGALRDAPRPSTEIQARR